MGKQFAVFNIKKSSSSGGGLGHHIDRTPGKEHMYKNADPSRRHLNHDFSEYSEISLSEAVNKRIKEGYKGEKTIRKDAVKLVTCVFTGSPEQMEKIKTAKYKSGRSVLAAWLSENRRFAQETFGAENIVRFTLHMDEKTPHIHCSFVPLTPDGRLSAKEILGNKKKYKERLTAYADTMKPFGLVRGEKMKRASHETIEYHSALEKSVSEVQNKTIKELKQLSEYERTELERKLLKSQIIDKKVESILKRKPNKPKF